MSPRCHEVSPPCHGDTWCHEVSRGVTGCHRRVTDVSPMCHNVSPMCHGVSRGVTVCHRRVTVSRRVTVCHGRVTDVSRRVTVCHGRVTDVSRMCHRVSRVCHRVSRACQLLSLCVPDADTLTQNRQACHMVPSVRMRNECKFNSSASAAARRTARRVALLRHCRAAAAAARFSRASGEGDICRDATSIFFPRWRQLGHGHKKSEKVAT